MTDERGKGLRWVRDGSEPHQRYTSQGYTIIDQYDPDMVLWLLMRAP